MGGSAQWRESQTLSCNVILRPEHSQGSINTIRHSWHQGQVGVKRELLWSGDQRLEVGLLETRLVYYTVKMKWEPYRWISWHFLSWELDWVEGITSPCCLLIGQYPHRVTLCPPVVMEWPFALRMLRNPSIIPTDDTIVRLGIGL